jgi:hypothetical protein
MAALAGMVVFFFLAPEMFELVARGSDDLQNMTDDVLRAEAFGDPELEKKSAKEETTRCIHSFIVLVFVYLSQQSFKLDSFYYCCVRSIFFALLFLGPIFFRILPIAWFNFFLAF